MNVGKKIKLALLEKGKTQKWLAQQTGIPYDKLNLSLCGRRVITYEELSLILWALKLQASDLIIPRPPKQEAS